MSKRDLFCVTDLANRVGTSISNTSHQLRKLELAGLIEPERRGRKICYRIVSSPETRAILRFLHDANKQ